MRYEPDPNLTRDRRRRVAAIPRDPAGIVKRQSLIHARILKESLYLQEPNFRSIGTADLMLMISMYDALFFAGEIRRMLDEDGAGEIEVSLSKRMTKTGGLTERRVYPAGPSAPRPYIIRYRLAVSTTLLFQSFRPETNGRKVTVVGLPCGDRLEALQRVVEHELLHLLEMLAWGSSDCSAENFLALSREFFGHRSSSHDLVTGQEIASRAYDVRVGDRVSFEFEGTSRIGVINKITRRATVLVESPTGALFTDGKKYLRYYIPLGMLKKV